MKSQKSLRSRFEDKIGGAWNFLTEGWHDLLSRGGGSLTQFDESTAGTRDSATDSQDFPRWSLLAGEAWETAQSLIIRIEVPGMRKEDLDISIRGNTLVVRGVKRSEGEHKDRKYSLTERAYGIFQRTIALTHEVDREGAEVSYVDGVLTVILPKTDPIPPRQLTIS